MAPYRYDRLVSDDEFRQRVRRHRPSSLLPLVAAAGAQYDRSRVDVIRARGAVQLYRPWSLAEVARTSLVFGTEVGRSAATEDDLLSILCAHAALRDPELHRRDLSGAVGRFFLRISSEQLSFNLELLYELSRTAALFAQTTSPKVAGPLASPSWATDLLGCSLSDYVGIGLLLHIAALRNSGRFRLDCVDQPNFEPIVREVPAATFRHVVPAVFETDVARFRAAQHAAPPVRGEARRFGYNPLTATPLITGVLDDYALIPVPVLLIRKVSPLGIYYAGVARWGNAFAEDTGALFEAYVGRQLALSPATTVLPAIEYHDGRDRKDTVDWIAVFDELVLLVEVKSVRPTEAVRIGTPSAESETRRMLGRAVTQLNVTASRIRDRHPAVRDIPGDRPIVGLVVTMEPFYTINSPMLRGWLPSADIPMSICSASELEHLVTAQGSVSELLLQGLTDSGRDGWSVRSLLQGHPLGRNPLIDAAFDTYPWREAAEADADAGESA